MQAFAQPQAKRVDRPEEGPEVRLAHGVDKLPHLVDRQHVGEGLGPGDPELLECLPVARRGVGVEKPDGAGGDPHRARGEMLFILEVENVLSDLALGEFIGGLAKVIRQPADRLGGTTPECAH